MSKDKLNRIEEAFSKNEWSSEISELLEDIKDDSPKLIIPFISKALSNLSNEKWVLEALRSVPYVSKFSEFQDQKEKINDLLPQIFKKFDNLVIRETCVIIRGNLSSWPDTFLRSVILTENASSVKMFAFKSILVELDLPESVVDNETERVANGEIEPDFNEINRITQNRADGKYDNFK